MTDSKKRKGLVVISGLLILVAIYFLFFMNASPPAAENPENLLGNWVRTDAPYKIEVKSVDEDGLAEAAYFNPNPIHVGSAQWEVYEHQMVLYVEMQDVNYPGSNYTLTYHTNPEKLSGAYFQAVTKETFAVEFTRSK